MLFICLPCLFSPDLEAQLKVRCTRSNYPECMTNLIPAVHRDAELAASGVLVFGADPNAKAPARKRRSVAEKAKEHDRQMQEYFRDDSNYCEECRTCRCVTHTINLVIISFAWLVVSLACWFSESHIKGMYCHTCKKDLCISCSSEIHKSDLTSWHKRIAIFKKNDFLEVLCGLHV